MISCSHQIKIRAFFSSAEKHVTGHSFNRGRTFHRCLARENIQPLPRTGKHAISAKRGKTCHRCQARENVQPVRSTGEHTTGAKRGKTYNRCQVRENMQPLPRAEAREYMQPVPGMEKQVASTKHAILSRIQGREDVPPVSGAGKRAI